MEENITIDIRKIFRLKKELHYTAITGIRNIFRHEKTKAIKDRIIRNINNLFEHEEEEIIINQLESANFGVTIILNTKVTVTKVKHY